MTVFRVFFDRHGSSEVLPEKAESKGTILAQELQTCSYLKVEASSSQRAAEAVKEGLGQGVETMTTFVGTEAAVEEKTA